MLGLLRHFAACSVPNIIILNLACTSCLRVDKVRPQSKACHNSYPLLDCLGISRQSPMNPDHSL
jgi:hypothetical protein